MSIPLTDADERLIAALQRNARMSTSDLARALGVSRSTVQARLSRLERSGVIEGYALRLSASVTSGWLHAQSLLRINPRLSAQVIAAAQRVSGVQALHSVAGEFDLLAQLQCPDAPALDAALDAIAAIDGVERTQSSVLLSEKFRR
jgi:DNA-binding Lrp family transcriptional regulator